MTWGDRGVLSRVRGRLGGGKRLGYVTGDMMSFIGENLDEVRSGMRRGFSVKYVIFYLI